MDIRFTPSQCAAFGSCSGDHNPLHSDDRYAGQTPFGRPVVYGALALLTGLARWANGRAFRLRQVRAEFLKPLLTDETYSLDIEESADSVRITFGAGNLTLTRVILKAEWIASLPKTAPVAGFFPRSRPNDRDLTDVEGSLPAFSYAAALDRLPEACGLSSSQCPVHQLHAICGASYLVGMENPGTQALFSELELVFSEAKTEREFRWEDTRAQLDSRFGRVALEGRGTGVSALRVFAFYRPRPVHHDIEDIRARVGTSTQLAGKTVLLAGASRGFGAVMAKTLALQGANTILLYRQQEEIARRVCEEVLRYHPVALALKADLCDAEQLSRAVAEANRQLDAIDLLILNAVPVIPQQRFSHWQPRSFLDFVNRSLMPSITACSFFLPRMRPGGTVLGISTHYVAAPPIGFSHYVTAKTAMEGHLRSLSPEYPQLRFLVARLPRMLTDQTSFSIEGKPAASPIEVARELLPALFESTAGYQEIAL